MLIVTGEVDARDGAFDALLTAGKAHSARSRGEAGCVSHNCYIDPETPGRIFFYERWTDRAALDVHFKTAGVAELMTAVRAHAARTGDIGIFAVTDG